MKKVLVLLFIVLSFNTTFVYAVDSNSYFDDSTLLIENEDEFINYMKSVFSDIKNSLSNRELSNKDKEKIKNTFIMISDFIFYDGEIKGMKFSELSDKTKKEVLKAYINLDSLIEKNFPNYKEEIKSSSKKQYNNLKGKAIKMLNKHKNEIKTKLYKAIKNGTISFYSKIRNSIK